MQTVIKNIITRNCNSDQAIFIFHDLRVSYTAEKLYMYFYSEWSNSALVPDYEVENFELEITT